VKKTSSCFLWAEEKKGGEGGHVVLLVPEGGAAAVARGPKKGGVSACPKKEEGRRRVAAERGGISLTQLGGKDFSREVDNYDRGGEEVRKRKTYLHSQTGDPRGEEGHNHNNLQ